KEKPAVVKIPIGAPPPYAEPIKGTVGTTISGVGTASLPVSTTQETSASQDRTAMLQSPAVALSQPPPLPQLKAAVTSPKRPTMSELSAGGQPSLPVPAQPPNRTVLPIATSPKRLRRAAGPKKQPQPGAD
ncbi:unnamed protein product, partial [Strongylus vulgaris]